DTKEKKVELEKVGAGQKEKKGRWWIIPLIALLLLAFLAGAWLAWTSFAPAPTGDNETAVEPMTEQAVISDSLGLITIDRTAIPGEGNVLEVDRPGQLILEMEISNPTDDNIIFNLAANDEESWLSIPNDELYITPKGKNTAQLIITPDMDKLRSEDYTVNVTVSIRGGGLDYQQDIPLTISKKKDFFDTWWFWLLIGLLVAASLVLLTAGLRRLAAGRKKEGSYYEQVPEKDTFEGPRERNLWKWAFIILIGAILLGALIAGGLFLWNDMKRETVLSETPVEPVPNKEPISLAPAEPAQQEAIVEVDLSGLSGKGNTIVVENNETLIIPMTVMNPSDESVVFIAVTSDDTWITVEEPQMELAPHSSEGTYVWITPDMDLLKKKDYTVGINTTLEGATVDYTQSLDFDITEPRSIFNSIWFYMLLGVLIAVLIIWLISRDREKKEEEYENYFSHDEPEETEKPKKKTNKRTKIGLKKK
ncbi:MAG: hypothetical protein ACE5DM_00440, partial [Candidatus Nanoarchaeia archaeon]